jgi:hypothetical protein
VLQLRLDVARHPRRSVAEQQRPMPIERRAAGAGLTHRRSENRLTVKCPCKVGGVLVESPQPKVRDRSEENAMPVKQPAAQFRVDVSGLKLTAEASAKLTAAIQSAALSQLAQIDTKGDTIAIAFPRLPGGSTQGIWIVPSTILNQVPDLRKTLSEFGVPE